MAEKISLDPAGKRVEAYVTSDVIERTYDLIEKRHDQARERRGSDESYALGLLAIRRLFLDLVLLADCFRFFVIPLHAKPCR